MRLLAMLVVAGLGFGVLAPAGGVASAGSELDTTFHPETFADANGDPYPIDNPCFPLIPGTTFVYLGMQEEGLMYNEYTVTYETKEILGVTCTVVQDVYWLLKPSSMQWELVEVTTDWHAQDVHGNVWYFGEDSSEKNDGEDPDDDDDDFWEDDGSWQAGDDGALPGIVMPAPPKLGKAYRQEYYAGVAEDWGKCVRDNVRLTTGVGSYQSCLKVKEWSTIENGQIEYKYYAHGVGLVLTEGAGYGVESELIHIYRF